MINNQHIHFILSVIAISASLVTIFVAQIKGPRLAMVDMGRLISVQASKLGQQYPDGHVPTVVMQQVITEVNVQVDALAKDKNLILMAKGAILSGNVSDYTDVISESLEAQDEEHFNEQAKRKD